jgi:hypothetical protein
MQAERPCSSFFKPYRKKHKSINHSEYIDEKMVTAFNLTQKQYKHNPPKHNAQKSKEVPHMD